MGDEDIDPSYLLAALMQLQNRQRTTQSALPSSSSLATVLSSSINNNNSTKNTTMDNEDDNDHDDEAEVQRLQQELYAKQQELMELKRIANSLNVYLQDTAETDAVEGTKDDENDTENQNNANGNDEATEGNEEDIAVLMQQLQDAMANAASLQAEADRLTSLRDTLQTSLETARKEETVVEQQQQQRSGSKPSALPSLSSTSSQPQISSTQSSASSRIPTLPVPSKHAATVPSSVGSSSSSSDDISNENLLPFLQAEMQHLAMQASAIDRGETLNDNNNADPNAVIQAMQQRLELLNKLEKLMHMEAILKATEMNDGNNNSTTNDDGNDNANSYGNDIAAVHALPEDFPPSKASSKFTNHTTLSSSSSTKSTDPLPPPPNQDDEQQPSEEDMAVLQTKLAELRMLEARAAALRERRDQLMQRVSQEEKTLTNTSSSSSSLPQSSSSSSGTVSSEERIDFSIFDPMDQIVIVRSRLALMSACMESPNFNEMVAYAVATLGTEEEQEDARLAMEADSRSAGPPAFIKAIGIAAILRNAVRKAAVYASRTMTQSANSVQELLESDEFTEAFRQETVKALLSRIPVAHDMMSNGILDQESDQNTGTNAFVGNNNAQEVDLPDDDQEEQSNQPVTSLSSSSSPSRTTSPNRTSQSTLNTTHHSEYNVVDMSIASTTNTTMNATVPSSKAVPPPSLPPSASSAPTNKSSSTNASTATVPSKKLSTFDRLAQPRRDRIVPKAETKTDTTDSKKPEFRTWPKRVSQNTKMPKTGKPLPKVPNILEERKGESTYDGSSLGDMEYVIDENGNEVMYDHPSTQTNRPTMDEFDSLTATANAWASKSRIPGAADLVNRALQRVNSASTGFHGTSTQRINIDTDISPFAVEEALVSPRVTSILQDPREDTVRPVPPASPHTKSRFAELAASKRASSPTSRAKTGWSMPSYSAVNAIPPLRVFDATQSSAKRTAETTQYIRNVFPYVTTAAIPPGTAALIAEEEAAKHHHKVTSSIEDEILSTASLPRPRSPPKGSLGATSRPSSPLKAFDASTILGKDAIGISSAASVISATRSTSRRQRAGSSGASVVSSSQRSSVTAFNRSVSPSKRGQMGRPTMIHATKLLIPTQVLGPVWAKIAGNIPENKGRGRFRILRYSKVPPPPPAYWFTSASEGKRSQGVVPPKPITSMLSDLRSEVRTIAKETINSPTGVENLMKGLPPRSTSPRSPALQKVDSFFNGCMLGTMGGDVSRLGLSTASTFAASILPTNYSSTNDTQTRLNFSSVGTNFSRSVGPSTVVTNTGTGSTIPITVNTALPTSPRVYSLPTASSLATNTSTGSGSTVRNITLSDLDSNDAFGTKKVGTKAATVQETLSPKPTLETSTTSSLSSASSLSKPPLSSRPSLMHIDSHIDDEDSFVSARNSRVLQRVPSLAEMEEAKVEEVAQIIMKARDRISTVSSAVNSRTAVTDSAFGPTGIIQAIHNSSAIPSAAVIVTYGEDDDSDHETQKQRTQKRDGVSISTETVSQEKNTSFSHDENALLERINKANSIALNRIATASFRLQNSSQAVPTKSTAEHLRDVELEAEIVEDEDDIDDNENVPEEDNGYDEDDDEDDEDGEMDEAKVHPEPVVSLRAQSAASILLEPAGTADARPTTSRKVPHPGVDEFYSYVRTSPSKTETPTKMSNDVAARVALAKAGILNQPESLLQAPQQVDAALVALRRQAALFEARAKLRMQGTEPDTASDEGNEGFDLGDDEVEIHQDTDENEPDETVPQTTNVNRTDSLSLSMDDRTVQSVSYSYKAENQPYDYGEEIVRTTTNKVASPKYTSTVPPVWANALREGYPYNSVTNSNLQFDEPDYSNEDTDGQSSVTTDLDHMDANAIIASAEAEVLAEMMANQHRQSNDNDSHDGSSTVEADAQLAAGILRAADERLNYGRDNDNDNDDEQHPDEETDENMYGDAQDALDASLNTSYLTALAEAEKQVVEQRRMVAELQDFIPSVSPKKIDGSSKPTEMIVNDVLLTKNGLFQRLSPSVKPNSSVTTTDYEIAAANLAARNTTTSGSTYVTHDDENDDDADEGYDDGILGNGIDDNDNDDDLIESTNQPLPVYPPTLDDQEEGSISSWTHADSENNLHAPDAYHSNSLDNSSANANNAVSRRLATLRRRSRKWSTEFKQRRAVALAVALRTINSWGTSVAGSPGSSAPRPLRIQELEELVLDIGSALTGLAPGILALGNQENMVRHTSSNDTDEDQGITSNVLATQNLLNPLAILSRRRKVTIAGAALHGIQAFAYSVWMTVRPSLHAALLCYIGADAKAPATQKWLLRDVRTGLADWASVASAALMDTSSASAPFTNRTGKPTTTNPVPLSNASPFLSPTTKAMRLTGAPVATNPLRTTIAPPPVPTGTKTNTLNGTSSSTKFTLPSSTHGKTPVLSSQPTTNAARTFAHQRYAMQSDGTWAAVEDSFSTDDTGDNKSVSSASERDLLFHAGTTSNGNRNGTNTISIKPGGKIELRPPQPNPALGPDDLNQHTYINAHLLASLARNMPNQWNNNNNYRK